MLRHRACFFTRIDKAIRGIRGDVFPFVKGPLHTDPKTGQLSFDTVTYVQNLAGKSLTLMVSNGEIDSYTVYVDANQNVKASSQVIVQVNLTILGVARSIVVKIGF